mmetsp:Transcript_2135/g.6523  ORF Transcript_2135/g.6523 Transcript_2135/m.6523 type:complete len:1254 (+) Transcript_2135:79-3840(+)
MERVRAWVDACLTFDVETESWRSLRVGEAPSREGSAFCDNSIKTSKYNVFTFIPRSLFEQFRRTANQYFLFISILMILGSYTELFYSPLTAYSTIAPLAVILAVTMGKEGIEDLKRHRSDEKVNNTLATVVRSGELSKVPWRALAPGDRVVVSDREEIPADLVLLSSSEENGQAYVETSNIDGESNLKIKKSAAVETFTSRESTAAFGIEFEPPCGRIHTFEGTLKLADTTVALTASHFLLRGSTLRNTKWALGVVAYTGRDTRLVRNSREAPSKLSEMERVVNNMVLFILFSMAVITSVSTVAYAVWNKKNMKNLWYLCYRYNQADVPPLFSDNCNEGSHYATGSLWFTFFILYNNFIPISLYVTIEVINYAHAYYIDNDLTMYDEESDTPAVARTSNMNADLGMIKHIFSDKTGTLTRNVMKFERCSVGGHVYGAPDATPPYRLAALRQVVLAGESPGRDLATVMAVCHTVVPEKQDDELVYQAESPDEEALVKGASELGLTFDARTAKSVSLEAAAAGGNGGTRAEFEVLAVVPFDSTRKRMSVVVKMPNGKIRVMTKGADTIVLGLAKSGQDFAGLRSHLDAFAREGLRTLVLAQRDLSSSQYRDWAKKWHDAETASGGDRATLLALAAAQVETDLDVVGATAIEDKLQEGVPETVADLASAGIKVWVLTGDKTETAINIGYSAKLLTPEMYLIRVPVAGAEKGEAGDYGVRRQLEALEALVADAALKSSPPPPTTTTTKPAVVAMPEDEARRNLPKPLLDGQVDEEKQQERSASRDSAASTSSSYFASDHLALVVEGSTAIEVILGDPELEDRLLTLASACRAVVACRVSPAQKRLIVKLVKDASKRKTSGAASVFEQPITLAVGDGANDVGMIQEAQIGVGISGKEGRQAVNNSDFAIAQFRFLKPLLTHHGRRNYRRLSKVIIYSFFKNIVLTFVLFYFQADCGWSGTSFYESWVYSGYNFFLGLLPFCMGFFDIDIRDDVVDKYPRLYAAGLHRMDLNVVNTVYQTIEAVAASLLVYFPVRETYSRPGTVWDRNGKTADVWGFGTTVFVAMVAAMAARAVLLVESWNALVLTCLLFQAAMLYTFILFMAQTSVYLEYSFYGAAYHIFGLSTFWLISLALVPAAVTALQLLVTATHLELFPTISDIGKEIDHGHLDGRNLDPASLPLRARGWLRDALNALLGFSKDDLPTLVTRDSLRQVHQSLTREESLALGIHDDVASSFAFDTAADTLGAGAGPDNGDQYSTV